MKTFLVPMTKETYDKAGQIIDKINTVDQVLEEISSKSSLSLVFGQFKIDIDKQCQEDLKEFMEEYFNETKKMLTDELENL